MKKIIYIFLLFASTVQAQLAVPFWTENFTNGIPSTWTNVDASNGVALWTWCSNPSSNGMEAGCPLVWNTPANQQIPFQATTASTGFVTLDSDEYGELLTDHVSRLTTNAIDCAGKNQVFVKLQTHLGTFTYDADDKAILKVSTDQTNWSTFQIFNGLTQSIRWSANPEIPIIDISSVAANQSTVYLQWEWTGNYEYLWSIDDVELYSQNPTPDVDLKLTRTFYPPSSYATPASEIRTDTFGFYGWVSNNGLLPQTNVELKAWITNSNGAVLFADSITIDELPVGYKDSVLILNKLYAPEVTAGTYNIHYEVSSDAVDARPSDNTVVSEFVASGSYFAKEDGPEQYVRPAGADALASWYVANYYKMSKSSVEKYRAISADFAHTTDADEVAITEVTALVYLLRIKDNITDDLDNLVTTNFLASYDWVGLSEYTAADTIVDDGSIRTAFLTDFNTGEAGVVMENGARYMLAIAYADDSRFVFHAFNNDNNYYFNSTLLYYDGDYATFGTDANAVLRLNLALVSTTDNIALPDYALQLFPNPVSDRVNLGVKLDEAGPLTITIADLSGKVIVSDDYEQVQQQQFSYNLPASLPSGIYLARIATNNGTLTKRFVVEK